MVMVVMYSYGELSFSTLFRETRSILLQYNYFIVERIHVSSFYNGQWFADGCRELRYIFTVP